jgi:hypothetical protein
MEKLGTVAIHVKPELDRDEFAALLAEIKRQVRQAVTDAISEAAGTEPGFAYCRRDVTLKHPVGKCPYDGDDELTTCCGQSMEYTEFAHIRRYHCVYRSHHDVIYVDQRDGTWERRAQ